MTRWREHPPPTALAWVRSSDRRHMWTVHTLGAFSGFHPFTKLTSQRIEYAYQHLNNKWNKEQKVRQFVIHFCMTQTALYTSEGIPCGKCKGNR